jgi:hypothetical protein
MVEHDGFLAVSGAPSDSLHSRPIRNETLPTPLLESSNQNSKKLYIIMSQQVFDILKGSRTNFDRGRTLKSQLF